MDSPTGKSGITRYLTQELLEYGVIKEEKVNYDLQQIVMVYIGDDRKHIRNRFLRMLYDLFKDDESAGIRKKNLKQKYQIIWAPKAEKEVDTMCNLSVGVYRRGIDKGAEEQKKTMIIEMLLQKINLDVIATVSKCTKEYIRQLAEEKHINIC